MQILVVRPDRVHSQGLGHGRRTFLTARAILSIMFEESLSHGHGNFEDQNKFLELSIIIISALFILEHIILAYN
jgi:hypothetical protein